MRLSQVPAYIRDHPNLWPWRPPSPEQLLDLVQDAFEQLESDAAIDVGRENAKAINRLNFLYAKCCAIQDYKGAASVQKELNGVVTRVAAAKAMEEDDDE
jgi:hypothetical protein